MRNGHEAEQRMTTDARFPGQDAVAHNGICAPTALTICLSTWNKDTRKLITALSRQQDADKCALIILDNGSNDPRLTAQISEHIQSFPGPAKLFQSKWRLSTSNARRRMAELAESDWMLMLNANVSPDSNAFLARYLSVANARQKPALYAGGHSLKYAPKMQATDLHAAHAAQSEYLPADKRVEKPGPNVFATNILVHRRIIESVNVASDTGDWGWDYVDWGLSVSRKFRVEHIDNTVSDLDLSDVDELIRRYTNSGESYARAASQHRLLRQRRLFRAAKAISYLPFSRKIESLAADVVRNERMPLNLRLFGLRVFRAAAYAEYL
ncbi:MAG: glycosyltransferase [Pseudomonadota bacterium]